MRLFILITITVFLGIGTTTNAQPTVFNKVYDAYNSIDGGNALTQLSDSINLATI
jgi:N-acetylneuraminic acid mutarotase